MKNKIKDIIPGLIIAIIVGIIGKILGAFIPSFGAASFAIIAGIILGNTVFNKPKYNKGFNFSEKDLLSYSIVLMGATINFMEISSLGFNGILFIALQMTFTILVAYFIGKKLGFSQKYSLLMCSGNAVCGSSAIAATAPSIMASDKDKAISVTVVNLTGTILMFVLPVLTSVLYGHATQQTSAMMGGILQSVGQVIASAKFVNEDVVTLATVYKIIRIMFLVVVVMAFSRINVQHEDHVSKEEVIQREKKSKVSIPWYIIGFFIFCVLNSFGFIPTVVQHTFKAVSSNFEIIALAAIGLKVKFADLVKEGPKSMAYGILVGTCQVIMAIVLIKIFV
ncbi:putative sulfate exporter family transporter [Clostridium sp. SM-530-WT-3G]|uniref:YeiH family protein n=1 Tax=Clostridium sp. SM-530-WT-3G TaxID=2725303 RepID=UPI00145EF228|nr:putative sulfate exporter family transporter [Clostridium sp. SM-530-WT-3G]NME83033.1 putative sulfate exporter family transporter [Clostridium sp. SM-530-WT-3G]